MHGCARQVMRWGSEEQESQANGIDQSHSSAPGTASLAPESTRLPSFEEKDQLLSGLQYQLPIPGTCVVGRYYLKYMLFVS